MTLPNEKVRELIALTRKLTDELEARLGEAVSAGSDGLGLEILPFIGRTTVTPMVSLADDALSNRRRLLKDLILFARIYEINGRERRGTTLQENREISIAAGYKGAQSLNGWFRYAGEGGPALRRDPNGEVWLTANGHKWMLDDLTRFGELQLPEDLAEFVNWDSAFTD